MIIAHSLTLLGPDEARVQVQVSHNGKPGCKVEAEEAFERILNALLPKDKITVVAGGPS